MPVKTKYLSPVRPLFVGLLALLLTLGLAACGASNTPTPVATTPPATSDPAANVSGGTYNNGKLDLPGTTLLTVDPGLDTALKGLLGPGINPSILTLQIYGSDSEPPILGENADSALVKSGYVFHDVRGGTDSKLIINDSEGAGAYTKAGGPDLIVLARDAASFTSNGTPPGVDTTLYQKLTAQLQGKKSVLIVMSGQNIVQVVASNITPTPAPAK
ncbi:MAG: hypothetical protein J0I20_02685 [Chloroflexi bacterium]|nr:hypothetical protein [Chloroflexota bacterium]OJV89328.1 MAG: hypothetical protein BGO39_35680 [Chloroflexi bacterium 54-19]